MKIKTIAFTHSVLAILLSVYFVSVDKHLQSIGCLLLAIIILLFCILEVLVSKK